jgi:hypothetical protein
MKKLRQPGNPVVIRRGNGIGSGNAESDDQFLFDCFVDYPAVQDAQLLSSAGMILAGRTGAGKTAILRHIQSSADHSVTLDPFDMSMSYVANSDTLRFLDAIGADLDVLFQVLWKHVLCIEYIRLRFSIESAEKSRSLFDRITTRFSRDARRARAVEYLRKYEGRFWITMDQNVKEITENVERNVNAEIGGEVAKFKAGGQYERRISVQKKQELVARVKSIISHEQLAELNGVIEMLSQFESGDSMKSYFILIDKLDEKWVDESIRFRLIRALIESLRSFRKITSLKILVALRDDVIERVVQDSSDISFQREKFEDYRVAIKWSKSDLRTLVDKRLNAMFKRRYTTEVVGLLDVFPPTVGQKDTFEWMLERTLMRPRDIIAFVNECLDAADGLATVQLSSLRKAEVEYSRKRRDALLQEWQSVHPSLGKILSDIVHAGKWSCSLSEFCGVNGIIEDICLSVCSDTRLQRDQIYGYCNLHIEEKGVTALQAAQFIVAALYRVGAVGVKLQSQDRFSYCHLDMPLISPETISFESKMRVHPMLWAAYNLQDNASRAI